MHLKMQSAYHKNASVEQAMSNSSQDHNMFKEFRNDDYFSLTACANNKYGTPTVPKILQLTRIGKHVCLNDITVGPTV